MSLMPTTNPTRVVIGAIAPSLTGGQYDVKRVIGEKVVVEAAVFVDGHGELSCDLLWRKSGENKWKREPMEKLINDNFSAEFSGDEIGFYEYTVEAWINAYQTWLLDLKKKRDASQNLQVDYQIGIEMLKTGLAKTEEKNGKLLQVFIERIEKEKDPFTLFQDSTLEKIMRAFKDDKNIARKIRPLSVRYQRKKALFSTWYELFPRSFGGFKGVIELLPEIAEMGFDVLYFPPIHPIGKTHRKGKNNSAKALKADPGCPWAIGSELGGHDAIHPDLGTFEQFSQLIQKAKSLNIEIALDLALQCSPDHPYIKEHPEWFIFRPDGTVQFAENPPKKYEDIVPINFDTKEWETLWKEILRIVLFWVDKGVRIFRVDNPHTKPFAFWKWLIASTQTVAPDVIFLSEAFTRPQVMLELAKVGFDQSYTYFTWRNTKHELMSYVMELTTAPFREFFRPNFWPNTPDILPYYLQHGGRPAFIIRFLLAATLSSNCGIYGPAFECLVNAAIPEREEYLNSEKYELIQWEKLKNNTFSELISLVNAIRKEHAAFQTTWNLKFCSIENEQLLAYCRGENFLVIVNLDPFNTQIGTLEVPLEHLGLQEEEPFLVHDHLSARKYIWTGRYQYIELNPHQMPAHIFQIHQHLQKEQTFSYFM